MFKRKIFKKREKKNKRFYFFLLMVIFIFLIYIFFLKKINYFTIHPNTDLFYNIPDDKEGMEIPNTDKKGLHLSHNYTKEFLVDNNPDIKFSIQIQTDNDYFVIKIKKIKLINLTGNIFNDNNLFIAKSSSNLGVEYFLLFGNFGSKLDALIFCKKFIYIDSKCIVVNVQKLD